jgi:glycosyltransferase involved in cell wall biosynthesis
VSEAGADRANVECLILTRDEEVNLPHTLEALLPWARRVHIVDSGSTDRTLDIARCFAERFPGQVNIVEQPWLGYARQKNRALETLPIETDWALIVDADEVILPELRDEIVAIAQRDPADVPEAGFYINRYFIFLGRRIRHCGFYPSWNLRLFKRGSARYEEREVHEHMIVDGPAGYLRGHMEHNDRRGLAAYMAKHNRYSTLEAREIHAVMTGAAAESRHIEARLLGNALERRRWIKQKLYPKLPARWLFRFCYMYLFRFGFLDGLTGLRFCLFMSAYELLIGLKIVELQIAERGGGVDGRP